MNKIIPHSFMVGTGVAGPALTVSDAVIVMPPSSAVTVCGPDIIAVQLFPVHEPSGVMENVVAPVTLPKLFPYASKPFTV